MTGVIIGLIVAIGTMCAFWGFIVFLAGLVMESGIDVIIGALMVLIPLIAGCIYVGVAG